MSAAEQQSGSVPGTDGQDLEVLRASLRCGRSLPARHLVEQDEAFTQRSHLRDLTALCGTDVADPDAEDPECPGCRDCLRYCPDCVREAHRWSGEDELDKDYPEPEPLGRFVGECGHFRVLDYRGRIGPCPCDTEASDPAPAAPGSGSEPAP